ncbi:MAG: RNA polymerase sigma factor [Phycisphaerales bacterium]
MPDEAGHPRPGAPSSDESLRETVRRAADGEASAWESLVRAFARRIYAAAKSRLGDPESAEEVTQSVMASVYATITSGGYREQGSFESWLFRIVMNRVRDAGRKRTRDRRFMQEFRPDRPRETTTADSGHEMEALRDAISQLSATDQEVISLRHHAGLSFAQISEVLDAPLGTVLARHHRALAKLRDRLSPVASETTR